MNFSGGRSGEFWGLVTISLVLYLLSDFFQSEYLQNLLIVAAALVFGVALLRLRRSG